MTWERTWRENATDQAAAASRFKSDWLIGWYEFSRTITDRSKAKERQYRVTVDTHLKIALKRITYQKKTIKPAKKGMGS